MEETLFWSRLQFAFTITYHYLFPQLTMGLAWILVFFKWRHWRTGDERFGRQRRAGITSLPFTTLAWIVLAALITRDTALRHRLAIAERQT